MYSNWDDLDWALSALLVIAGVAVPLALWKLVEVVVWASHYVHFGVN